MSGSNVLIIEDEEKLREVMVQFIGMEGYHVFEAATAKAGFKKMEQEDIDVVVCDVKLPDANGVELAGKIKTQYPLSEVIVLTAYGNIPNAVQAIKNGAFDYLTKGDDNDKLIPLINKALDKVRLQKRIQQLQKQVSEKFTFDEIIHKSKLIDAVIDLAKKVAPTNASVLLLGETGTGKEVFAEAIHSGSKRNTQPFVAVNCSAISKDLLENELFGHKAGSYTGAVKDAKGLFEEANHGTIFLDEVGEMSQDLQAKFLRVLETGEFIRVGDTTTTKVDVRIIAATNRDLLKECDEGHFRLDLYYRLSAFQITLPALKERPEDIELLVKHFVKISSAKMNKAALGVSQEYIEKLKCHQWKGNIRELKNVVERSVILSDSDTLDTSSLPYEMQVLIKDSPSAEKALELASVEKCHIQKILMLSNGNKSQAAKILGIGTATLYRKLHEYELE